MTDHVDGASSLAHYAVDTGHLMSQLISKRDGMSDVMSNPTDKPYSLAGDGGYLFSF